MFELAERSQPEVYHTLRSELKIHFDIPLTPPQNFTQRQRVHDSDWISDPVTFVLVSFQTAVNYLKPKTHLWCIDYHLFQPVYLDPLNAKIHVREICHFHTSHSFPKAYHLPNENVTTAMAANNHWQLPLLLPTILIQSRNFICWCRHHGWLSSGSI